MEYGRQRGVAKRSSQGGIVVGFSPNWAHCVRIRRDGTQQAETFAGVFWDVVPQAAEPGPRAQILVVPADFVVHQVEISDGATITLALPPRLTRRQVERLRAFLETQVDEETP